MQQQTLAARVRPWLWAGLAGTALLWNRAAADDQLAAVNPAQLFGTTEIHSTNLKMFPKWRGTLRLFERELKSCGPDQCKRKQWQAVVDGLRGKDLMTQLREINTEMNDKRYITDPVNWNLPDYWATPLQFMRKNGDCEDYAIAKYMALRISACRSMICASSCSMISICALPMPYLPSTSTASRTFSTTRSPRLCRRIRFTTTSPSIR